MRNDRPTPIDVIQALEKESGVDREQKNHDEEARVREIERVFTNWTRCYDDLRNAAMGTLDLGRHLHTSYFSLTLEQMNLLTKSKDSGELIMRFKESTHECLRTIGSLENIHYGMSKILQALGRNSDIADKTDMPLGKILTLTKLWKDCVVDDALTSESIGEFGVWLQQNSDKATSMILLNVVNNNVCLYRYDEQAHRDVGLPEEIQKQLPESFFQNPTEFIENLPNVDRPFFTLKVSGLVDQPYDTTRVKQFGNFVFKRVDLQLVEKGNEEIKMAQEMQQQLANFGIDIKIPIYHGMVHDHGNVYLVEELVPNCVNLSERFGYDDVLIKLADKGIVVNPSNVLVQYQTEQMRAGEEIGFWMVDFENSPIALKEEQDYERRVVSTLAPEIERRPSADKTKARSERYDVQGITVEFAREILELIEEKHLSNQEVVLNGLEHLETFYLNSSDSIELLKKHIDVQGEHVVTVGASGDFAKIFLQKGAKSVDVFDISLPAIFYNELSMVALQELDFESYKDFINFWKMNENQDGEQAFKILSIFEVHIYAAVRGFLSEQARAYFDELIKKEKMFKKTGKVFSKFAQIREQRGRGPERNGTAITLIGDLIKDEAEYLDLQNKARATETNFSWVSVNAIAESIARSKGAVDFPAFDTNNRERLLPAQLSDNLSGTDTVYLSNIDYAPEQQVLLAKLFLQAGVKRVLLTVCGDRLGAMSYLRMIDADSNIIDVNPHGESGQNLLAKNGHNVRGLFRYDGKPVLPGEVIKYKGVDLHIVDYNDRVQFGMLVEIKK